MYFQQCYWFLSYIWGFKIYYQYVFNWLRKQHNMLKINLFQLPTIL